MYRVCTAADLPEAYLLRDRLRMAGIESCVFNENAQGAMGEIPFIHTYPELWVSDAADLEQARRIIDDFQQAAAEAPSQRCTRCGEENPGTFEICWRCGSALR